MYSFCSDTFLLFCYGVQNNDILWRMKILLTLLEKYIGDNATKLYYYVHIEKLSTVKRYTYICKMKMNNVCIFSIIVNNNYVALWVPIAHKNQGWTLFFYYTSILFYFPLCVFIFTFVYFYGNLISDSFFIPGKHLL